MTLGQRLAKARREKGLTQAQVAGAQITRNMLSQLEHDQAEPSLKTLRYLSAVLEVPLAELLEGEDGGAAALTRARSAFSCGEYDACLNLVEQAPVQTEEGRLLACRSALAAGWAAFDRGDFAAAAALLEQGLAWKAHSLYAGAAEAEGFSQLRLRLALEEGAYAPALADLEQLHDGREQPYRLLLVRCYLASGRLREAEQLLRRTDGAQIGQWLLLSGALACARSRWEEALRLLERARAQGLNRPDLIDCLELLERCALARKDYELAYACAAQRRELS